jgi:hypothetical protein
LSSLVYPLTLLRKRISAASRPVMSHVAVIHVSLPYSTVRAENNYILFLNSVKSWSYVFSTYFSAVNLVFATFGP